MQEKPVREIYKLQALDRAFAILDFLSGSSTSLGLGEVAEGLDLHKSTAHRFLKVLERHRMIDQTASGKFRLGLRLFDYGNRAIEQHALRERAQQYLKKLVEEVGETAHLCVLENMHMVYIDKLEPERSIRMISRVGSSSPIYCTAVGKAVLAAMSSEDSTEIIKRLRFEKFTAKTLITRDTLLQEIARTKRRGYAVDDEEGEIGVRCVAVAIIDSAGKPVAAVSVSGPAFRITRSMLTVFVKRLMKCTQGICKEMGYTPQGAKSLGAMKGGRSDRVGI